MREAAEKSQCDKTLKHPPLNPPEKYAESLSEMKLDSQMNFPKRETLDFHNAMLRDLTLPLSNQCVQATQPQA